MIARQATFLTGWRQSPGWVRITLLAILAANVAGIIWLAATVAMAPMAWALVLVLNTFIVFALLGTVTDVFAAPPEARTQKIRSLAIGIGLMVLVITFFAATLIRLGGNVFNRPL